MSKIAFISDIHGNYPALMSVLADIDAKGVDAIYCLGDLVGYYSQINEVIDTVRSRNIPCIMGNHDYALVHENGIISRSKTCTNVLTRQLEYITPENMKYLSTLADSLVVSDGDYTIFAVHGGLNNHVDEYISELNDSYFDDLDETITHVITGHNHKTEVRQFSKVKYANSGSVGQPRDYNPMSSYVLYDDGNFEIIRVPYNIEATINKMQEDGFPGYIAEVLRKGCKIGG